MTFKLSKQERAQRDEHVERLENAWGELEQAISTYNGEAEKLKPPVELAIEKYNEMMAAAKEFAEQVAKRIEEKYDEKSEKWQEGEKGQVAAEFRDAWQHMDMEEIELRWPEEVSIDDPDHAPELAELPTEAE